MSTSTGHFLSLNKSHLNRPQTVFVYLGIEFDVPKQVIRVPEKRKTKIRNLLTLILADLECIPFHSLEKLRGMLISIAMVCPLARLYIREMNRALQHAEDYLQDSIISDPALAAELEVWRDRPLMLDHQNDMHRHAEMDIIPPSATPDLVFQTGITLLYL